MFKKIKGKKISKKYIWAKRTQNLFEK